MNYTEKLYKMRIDEFRARKHRFPKATELNDLGINRTYAVRKYGSVTAFYINLGYTEFKLTKKTDKIFIVDVETRKIVDMKYRGELERYYEKKLNNMKRYQGKYYLFTDTGYEIYKRSVNRDEFRRVMFFKFDRYLFGNMRTPRKYRNRRNRLTHMKETMPLEELIDVPKFADIEFL